MKKRVYIVWSCVLTLMCLCGCAFWQNSRAPASAADVLPSGFQTPGEETEELPADPQASQQVLASAGDLLPTLEDLLNGDISWRYTDDPARLDEIRDKKWTKAGFDDQKWSSGEGAFGAYKGRLDDVEGRRPQVCLRQYLPDGKNIPTYYFRLSFTAGEEDREWPLMADIRYDDAVVVYLNGKTVFSGNVPEKGYSSPNEYGCEKVGGIHEKSFSLDKSLLTEGTNVLAVELHQADEGSSDIYFELPGLSRGPWEEASLRNDTMYLGAGSDETEMLVTWQGPSGEEAYVQVESWAARQTSFSESASVYPAEEVYEDDYDGMDVSTYRAVLTGLEPGEYRYRVVDAYPSVVHGFTVADAEDGFSFLCHGDPQIGDDDDLEAIETYMALAEYAMEDEVPQLVLSLGDQSDDADDPDLYRLFMSTPLCKEVPLAAVVGNHEDGSEVFSHFFTFPNMDGDTVYKSGDMSGDYWFFRGNTLFLILNSNQSGAEEHAGFLRQAREDCVEQYGEPAWTVAAFHHSLFSSGDHAMSDSIVKRQERFIPLFEEVGVDVVFSGHDHTYTRSWPMDGTKPVVNGTDGDGIVYFTLTSSTGTKFYDPHDGELDYVAFSDASERPCMTRVDVTDTEMKVTTYCQEEDGAITVLDTYKLTHASK